MRLFRQRFEWLGLAGVVLSVAAIGVGILFGTHEPSSANAIGSLLAIGSIASFSVYWFMRYRKRPKKVV